MFTGDRRDLLQELIFPINREMYFRIINYGILLLSVAI